MAASTPRIDRLEGTTGAEIGGLIRRKPETPRSDAGREKGVSLFGLDKLALAKRTEHARKTGGEYSEHSNGELSESARQEIRRYVYVLDRISVE